MSKPNTDHVPDEAEQAKPLHQEQEDQSYQQFQQIHQEGKVICRHLQGDPKCKCESSGRKRVAWRHPLAH